MLVWDILVLMDPEGKTCKKRSSQVRALYLQVENLFQVKFEKTGLVFSPISKVASFNEIDVFVY